MFYLIIPLIHILGNGSQNRVPEEAQCLVFRRRLYFFATDFRMDYEAYYLFVPSMIRGPLAQLSP
jgi:hypothetical protein